MKSVRPLLPFFLLLFAFTAGAQGAYLEKGVNGMGGEARVALGLDGFEGFQIASGYSIAGILDVGGSVEYSLGKYVDLDSTDLRTAIEYRINALKQTSGFPLSLQISGSYGLNKVFGDYLDNNVSTRLGTGYTLGISISSNIPITSNWIIRISLLSNLGSTTYKTYSSTGTITTDRVDNLYFGGALGFLFKFPLGTILAVQAQLRADRDLALQINPIVSVAIPQR